MRRFQKQRLIRLLLLIMGCCMHSLMLGDTVILKNGKKFEGIIKKENSNEVAIDIGLGTVAFKRGQIARIVHSENQAVEKTWQREFVTRGKFVPDGLQEFAAKFLALESMRNSAVQARLANTHIENQRTQLFEEIDRIKQEISAIAAQFQSIIPEKNVQKYNALVKKQNLLASRSVIIKDTLSRGNAETERNREIISSYVARLDLFKQEIDQEKSTADQSDAQSSAEHLLFFSSIADRIEKFSTEFQQIEIPHQGARDHMLITVRINDHKDGVFLLDTGATYVTISSDLAQELGLELSSKSRVTVSLANGSNVKSQPVILDSMQVGNARVNGVIAMVFPNAPHKGVDGLLGMSFLREFTIHLDPANSKLVFQKFAPR